MVIVKRSVIVVAACLLAASAAPALAAGLPTSARTTDLARLTHTVSAMGAPGAHRLASGVLADVPSWARAANFAGAVPATRRLQLGFVLGYRDAAGLAALDAAVADPSSPAYGHYLSGSAFDARFAPPVAQVRTVTKWLRGAGLSIGTVASSHILITASGTASAVSRALHVRLGLFRYRGSILPAPFTDPVVPGAVLAAGVTGIFGLGQTPMTYDHIVSGPAVAVPTTGPGARPSASPPPAFVNAGPCSTYWGQKIATGYPEAFGRHWPFKICAYTPSQIRSAYSVAGSRLTGAGVTVGIVDAYDDPTIVSDVNTYSRLNGLPQLTSGQFTDQSPPGLSDSPEAPDSLIVDPQGWSSEETLDVEAVHTMAPGAHIVYFGATDPIVGLFVSELEAVELGGVNVITNSWGETGDTPLPGEETIVNEIAAQAVAKGIGINFAAGDNGDEIANTGTRQVDFPADNPDFTAVGGTALQIGSRGQYLTQTAWGTDRSGLATVKGKPAWSPAPPGVFQYGGGGGVSTLYAEPSYQKGVVPRSLATYGGVSPGRVVPDVAMNADPQTGFLVGQTQTFPNGQARYSEFAIGGTSEASPLFTGIEALVDQARHSSLGFANPLLYDAYRLDPGTYHDVLANSHLEVVRRDYSNYVDPAQGYVLSLLSLGTDGTLVAGPGYNDATGLGSPDLPVLLHSVGRLVERGASGSSSAVR